MDAITAMLSGDTLTDEDKMKQTADALRGSQRAGDFFAMSSLAPLQQLGQTQSARANKAAQRGGVMREAALRRASDAQAEKDALAAQKAAADLEWSRKLGLQKAKDEAALQRAMLKQGGKSGSNIGKIPAKLVYDFADDAGQYSRFEDLTSGVLQFDKDGNPIVEGLAAGGENQWNEGGWFDAMYEGAKGKYASDKLTEDEKRRKIFWDDYKKYYDYVERHGLFGSALSGNEKEDWEDVRIKPSDSNDMIARKLAKQREIVRSKFNKKLAGMQVSGLTDEQVRKVLPKYADRFIQPQEDVAPQAGQPSIQQEAPSLGMAEEEAMAQAEDESPEIAQDEVTQAISGEIEGLGYDPNELFGLMGSDPDGFNRLMDKNPELDAVFQKYMTE